MSCLSLSRLLTYYLSVPPQPKMNNPKCFITTDLRAPPPLVDKWIIHKWQIYDYLYACPAPFTKGRPYTSKWMDKRNRTGNSRQQPKMYEDPTGLFRLTCNVPHQICTWFREFIWLIYIQQNRTIFPDSVVAESVFSWPPLSSSSGWGISLAYIQLFLSDRHNTTTLCPLSRWLIVEIRFHISVGHFLHSSKHCHGRLLRTFIRFTFFFKEKQQQNMKNIIQLK